MYSRTMALRSVVAVIYPIFDTTGRDVFSSCHIMMGIPCGHLTVAIWWGSSHVVNVLQLLVWACGLEVSLR